MVINCSVVSELDLQKPIKRDKIASTLARKQSNNSVIKVIKNRAHLFIEIHKRICNIFNVSFCFLQNLLFGTFCRYQKKCKIVVARQITSYSSRPIRFRNGTRVNLRCYAKILCLFMLQLTIKKATL